MKSKHERMASALRLSVLVCAAMSALCASAGVSGARYLRFWVFKARSANYSKVDFVEGNRIGDFRLVKNGVELDWPAGTVCKYDKIQGFVQYGNPEQESTTKVLDKNDGTSAKDAQGKFTIGTYVGYAPNQQVCYTICLPDGESVDFDEYAVYRGYDTRTYYQSPQDWRMEVSANGTDWFPIDEVRDYAGEDWACYGWYGVTPTPYYLSSLGCDLDFSAGGVSLLSGSMSYKALDKAVSARKLRWSVTNVVSGTSFHVREFNVGLGGVRCARSANASATSETAGASAVFDGDTGTGWSVVRDFSSEGALVAEIDLGEVKTFDGYDICVAGTETVSGDATPNGWTLEAQDPDTGLWHLVAGEGVESVGSALSLPNKCAWRSDYDGGTASTVRGKMFRLSTDGLPRGLTRTAEGFCGVAFSNAADTSVSFADATVGFAPGASLGGTVSLENAVLESLPGDALSSASVSGSGLVSFAGGEEAELPVFSPFDGFKVSGDEGVVTPAGSFTIKPRRDFSYMRYRVFVVGNCYSTTNGTRTGLSELEILDENGDKVFWPSGTSAYKTTDMSSANQIINGLEKFPKEGADKTEDRVPNRLAGGMTQSEADTNYPSTALGRTCAFLTMSSVEEVAAGPAFVIKLGAPVDFATYRLFATYNCIGLYECPLKFSLDVSFDGDTWHTVDSKEFLNNTWPSNINIDHVLFYKKSIDWDSVLPPDSDRIADGCVVNLKPGVTMTLDHVRETVGGVSGSGKVTLSGTSSGLVVSNSKSASIFSGSIEGDGAFVVDGGVMRLSGANLSGVTNIVVRNGGVLRGTALLPKDVEIATESGGSVRLNVGTVLIYR